MFTGLVEDLGKVKNIDKSDGYWNIEIITKLIEKLINYEACYLHMYL